MPSFRKLGACGLALAVLTAEVASSPSERLIRRDEKPALAHDANTIASCTWWWDNQGELSCSELVDAFGITVAQFVQWNPSITATCGNYLTGKSYCVEASGPASIPSPNNPTTTSTSTTAGKVTSTSITSSSSMTTTGTPANPGNGIETPQPVQVGMVTNCDSFYLVKTSDQCNTIASSTGITVAEFLSWNPSAGADCTGLWANTYACVSIIGHTPATPSPSTPWNGITTPSPVRDGMSGSCDSFYFVASGDTCAIIAAKSGITVNEFLGWNPSAGGAACAGLWANTYVCIFIIGHTPTTTAPGNGVATPSPVQDGITKSCKKFHLVASGETCATIAPKYSITVAQFVSWNPAAKADCTGLWANTYACVALL